MRAVALAATVLLLAGCVSYSGTREALDKSIPPCPEAGYAQWEIADHAHYNATGVRDSFEARGWHGFYQRYEAGGGGLMGSSPDRIYGAYCNLEGS